MFATRRKVVRKPKLSKNKFINVTKKDWKETNEQSNKDRGISGITYLDIAKAPPQLKVLSRGDSLDDIYSISNVIEK